MGAPSMSEVLIEAHFNDYASGIPCIKTTAEGTAEGPLHLSFEFDFWKDWVPFVRDTEVLHSWSLCEKIVRLTAKVPYISFGAVITVYTCILDKLETEGYLELVMCSLSSELGRKAAARLTELKGSPDTITPALTTFLGSKIPSVTSKLCTEEKFERFSLRLWPEKGGNVKVQVMLLVRDRIPLEVMTNKVFKMFSRELLGRFVRQVHKAGPQSVCAHRLALYQDWERKICACQSGTQELD